MSNIIELKNLNMSFEKKEGLFGTKVIEVLRDINLSVAAGEIVAGASVAVTGASRW